MIPSISSSEPSKHRYEFVYNEHQNWDKLLRVLCLMFGYLQLLTDSLNLNLIDQLANLGNADERLESMVSSLSNQTSSFKDLYLALYDQDTMVESARWLCRSVLEKFRLFYFKLKYELLEYRRLMGVTHESYSKLMDSINRVQDHVDRISMPGVRLDSKIDASKYQLLSSSFAYLKMIMSTLDNLTFIVAKLTMGYDYLFEVSFKRPLKLGMRILSEKRTPSDPAIEHMTTEIAISKLESLKSTFQHYYPTSEGSTFEDLFSELNSPELFLNSEKMMYNFGDNLLDPDFSVTVTLFIDANYEHRIVGPGNESVHSAIFRLCQEDLLKNLSNEGFEFEIFDLYMTSLIFLLEESKNSSGEQVVCPHFNRDTFREIIFKFELLAAVSLSLGSELQGVGSEGKIKEIFSKYYDESFAIPRHMILGGINDLNAKSPVRWKPFFKTRRY